jgi:phosphomannomutase
LQGGDDGVFAALCLLELLQDGRSLAELRRELPRMYITPDVRLPVRADDDDSIVRRLRAAVRPHSETAINGIRMETGDSFILVRQSVTETAVTIRIEGLTQHSLEGLVSLCLAALTEFSQTVSEQLSQ